MSVRPANLSLHAVGVRQDVPGPGQDVRLKPGVHLRWLFANERGFPWHGYHLFRRPHVDTRQSLLNIKPTAVEALLRNPTDPISLKERDDRVRLTADGPTPISAAFTSLGSRGAANRVTTGAFLGTDTDRFAFWGVTPPRVLGVDLNAAPVMVVAGRMILRIRVRLAFRQAGGSIVVQGLRDGVVQWRETISGGAGELVERACDHDHAPVSEIRFERGPGFLIHLDRALLLTDPGSGLWQALPGLAPIGLPIRHPDYPMAPHPESVEDTRSATTRRQLDHMPAFFGVGPSDALAVDGTIDLIPDSIAVRGNGTAWDERLNGAMLLAGANARPYLIWRVSAPDALLLSRPYRGRREARAAYVVNRDPFGQFYDALARLVEGGPAGPPMHLRSYAPRTMPPGTLRAERGSDTFDGAGTQWTDGMEGMSIRIVHADSGTVTLRRGVPLVRGTGTGWAPGLVGRTLVIDATAESFHVQFVLGVDRIVLDRAPDSSRTGLAYRVVDPETYRIESVASVQFLRLDQPYRGTGGKGLRYLVEAEEGVLGGLRPLDVLQLAALRPGLAQGLGLYAYDRPPDERAYDYCVIADHQGKFDRDADKAERWLNSTAGADWMERGDAPGDIDAAIAIGVRMEDAPRPAPPEWPRAYRLPERGRLYPLDWPAGSMSHAAVGLTWADEPPGQRHFAILHHVWRAPAWRTAANADPPSDDLFERMTVLPDGTPSPVSVAAVDVERAAGSRVANDPRKAIGVPIHHTDRPIGIGWWAYRINAMDLFGRTGALSTMAEWYEPSVPQPASGPPRRLHPFAVEIADVMPPPPPVGVQAWVLDPLDPHPVEDDAYRRWRQLNPGRIGLRIRWAWTSDQMHQAPDIDRFRIALHPRRMNVLSGTTLSVRALTDGTMEVTTDLSPSGRPADLVGLSLRCGGRSRRIVEARQASLLILRIRPSDTTPLAHGMPCAIAIPPDTPLHESYSSPAAWDRPGIVERAANRRGERTLAPLRRRDGTPLAGGFARIDGVMLILQDAGDLTSVVAMRDYLRLDGDPGFHRIVGLGPTPLELTLETAPRMTGTVAWRIGQVIERYEAILPDDGVPFDPGLVPSDAEPVVHGTVGVSAVDLHGNESDIGAPASIQRVLRQEVLPPAMGADDGEPLWAQAADWHGRSLITLTWPAAPHRRAHVHRALDASVFAQDARTRAQAPPLASDDPVFPAHWNPVKREAIARQVNALSRPEDYAALWNDAVRVVASLPRNDPAFVQITTTGIGGGTFEDTLEGLARNRYLYRLRFVDPAGNRSELGFAFPPVALPDVIVPRTPTVTRVSVDDGTVFLAWAGTAAPVARYRLYRSEDSIAARDTRDMTRLPDRLSDGTEPHAWHDYEVVGGRTYHYRLVAVGANGRLSPPTETITVRAVDRRPPVPPHRQRAEWVVIDASGTVTPLVAPLAPGQAVAVRLRWTHETEGVSFLFLRRAPGDIAWQQTTLSVIGTGPDYEAVDAAVDPTDGYVYRTRVLTMVGTVSIQHADLGIGPVPPA